MSTLEKIKISYGQLIGFGADHSYSEKVVRRFWGEKEELSIQEVLEKKVHPHLITWTLLHESILPRRVLHRISLLLARKFIREQRESWSSDIDASIDELLTLKEQWLNGEANDRDLEQGRRKAEAFRDMYQALGNTQAISLTTMMSRLLMTDTEACLQGVYYGTIESDKLTRELIADGAVSVAWTERLELVKRFLTKLADASIEPAHGEDNPTPDERNAFLELHIDDFHSQAGPVVSTTYAEDEKELPVGTIIAYAADTYQGSEPAGWLLCDGRKLDRTAYTELFNRIGTAWGAPSETSFYIPELRGLFLRAKGGSDSINPDQEKRIASKYGSNDKNKVGSFENYATKIPQNPFTGTIDNAGISRVNYDKGCQDPAALYKNNGNQSVTTTISKGGGNETRPKNKAVHYLIKYVSIKSQQRIPIPLASVFPFAGKQTDIDKTYWNLCDGTVLSNAGEYNPLFNVMGFIHGGMSDHEFLVPDYKDIFLRGVSGSDGNDPDAGLRESPKPDIHYPGNKPGVGSFQNEDTARPNNPFQVKVSVPNDSVSKIIKGVIRDLYQYNSGSVNYNLSQGGGDTETSPVSAYVNWLILRGDTPTDKLPVGTVIAYGSDTPILNDVWKRCDGSLLEKNKYPELFKILGEVSVGDQFQLPDYQGFFLRGAIDDTQLGKKQEKSSTKRPSNPFMGDIEHLPTSSVRVSGELSKEGASKDGSASMGAYEGGDSESRPKNCAVDYYIRAL